MLMNLGVFMFFCGLVFFSLSKKHLLLMIMSLEFMVLSIFFMMIILLNSMNNELFFSLVFLSFSVCEGVMGLTILVVLIRTHGNDYFQSFNVVW
uniref:NADH-ubiquinone oxidoreductase chain 4L n=2 Tax=Polyphaga TaxID=41084 RepID=A0A0S2MPR1_9CUCU|nr:NADH deshydrogenase subunit 4L [Paratenetus tropicalis]